MNINLNPAIAILAIFCIVMAAIVLSSLDASRNAELEATIPATTVETNESTTNTTIPTVPSTKPSSKPTVPSIPETEPAITEPEITTTAPTTDGWVYLGNFKCTAYCSCVVCCEEWALNRPKDENGNDIVGTASGAIAKAGVTIAVDTDVIPFGTEVKLNNHVYIAQDRGGAIKGNRIDIYFDSHQEALNWGVQYHDVWIKVEE